MFMEISVFVLSVAFLLFALFFIALLLQIRKAADTISVTLQTLNQGLPGILRNLEEITGQIHQASATVNRQIEDLSYAFGRLQRLLGFVADVGQIVQAGVRSPLLNTVATLSAVAKGVSVFMRVLHAKPELPDSSLKK